MRFARLIAHTPIVRRRRKGGSAGSSNTRSDVFERALDLRKQAAHLLEDSDERWPDPLKRDDGRAWWWWRGGT